MNIKKIINILNCSFVLSGLYVIFLFALEEKRGKKNKFGTNELIENNICPYFIIFIFPLLENS